MAPSQVSGMHARAEENFFDVRIRYSKCQVSVNVSQQSARQHSGRERRLTIDSWSRLAAASTRSMARHQPLRLMPRPRQPKVRPFLRETPNDNLTLGSCERRPCLAVFSPPCFSTPYPTAPLRACAHTDEAGPSSTPPASPWAGKTRGTGLNQGQWLKSPAGRCVRPATAVADGCVQLL